MRDITHKQITLRTAKATGILFCSPQTIELIKNNELPKGNLFDVARAAAFIGAKATPQLLPHCHPVNIDGMDISFEFLDSEKHSSLFEASIFNKSGIVITGNAKSIGRTGIEMEMLTAVSVAALEIYDMLKPVDQQLEIGNIKLLEKKGGKSDRSKFTGSTSKCAIMVCSDSTAEGKRSDSSGKLIQQMLEAAHATIIDFIILPDDPIKIQAQVKKWVSEKIDFIFTTGGTGLGPRDNTVNAISEILEKEAPGISEAIRNYGQMRTPLAMMSRAIAGSIAKTLVVTLPGSPDGARESLEAILPAVFHASNMLHAGTHD